MTDISEADIQSYIDRRADHETWGRVEAHMKDRPAIAARIRETREDMALLDRYFDKLEAQIPDRHIEETTRLIVDHVPRRRFADVPVALRIAAMFAFLFIGSAGVLGIKVSMTVPAYADAAALAYQDVTKLRTRTDDDLASNPQWLIDWLNEKTGLMIRVPYEEEHGFTLADGRLTVFDRHAAGLLIYEDWRKHRVVIFVTRVSDGDDPKPHFAIDRSTYINYWSRNGVGVVIAAADEGDLKEFTRATQKMIDVSAMPSAASPK